MNDTLASCFGEALKRPLRSFNRFFLKKSSNSPRLVAPYFFSSNSFKADRIISSLKVIFSLIDFLPAKDTLKKYSNVRPVRYRLSTSLIST